MLKLKQSQVMLPTLVKRSLERNFPSLTARGPPRSSSRVSSKPFTISSRQHPPRPSRLASSTFLPKASYATLSNPTPGLPIGNVSTVIGATSPPLDERTLSDFWSETVAQYPDSPALVSRWEKWDIHSKEFAGGPVNEGECIRWTFKEMDAEVDRLARGLLAMGLRKGDRAAVYLGNGSSYAMLQWATAKLGIILVCINPASKGPELIALLNLTSSKALFIPPSIRKNPLTSVLCTLFPTLIGSKPHQLNDPACPSLRSVVIFDNTGLGIGGFQNLVRSEGLEGSVVDFRDLLRDGEGLEGREQLENEDVINLQFTSGTTGLPKAVALTHRNLLNNGFFIGECMKLRPPSPNEGWEGERLCNSPPLFHCFGLVLGNLAVWTHGGCIIYPSETFNAAMTLRTVVQEKATALHGVPTMFVSELALLDLLEAGKHVEGLSDLPSMDFSSLRTGIAAGSPVPDEIMRKMIKRLNLRDLTITYGQTETSPATVMSSTDDEVSVRCTTVGRVMPHASIRIVDTSSPIYPSPSTPSVPLGVPGELWSAGYAVQKGYWRNDAETDKVVFKDADGLRWMMTGDEAIMTPDGYIKIVGRIKDIIIRGGENIFPVVVENRGLELPGIADCSVIAVPCPRFLETVGMFVQREDSAAGRALTPTDIAMHIDRVMSHQAKPEWVWFLSEDGVPSEFAKTASGKIRKVELREWAKDLQQKGVGKVIMPGKCV